MEKYIKKYFGEVSDQQCGKNCYKVLVLQDAPELTWPEVQQMAPHLPKGWFELAKLKQEDRLEFTRDFWISKLPYHPDAVERITQFFAAVDDIGVVIAEKHFNDPFEGHMIYSLKEEKGFFHGCMPMHEEQQKELAHLFPDTIFPADYLAFLQIHNGFSKSTDSGVISSFHLKKVIERFLTLVNVDHPPLTTKGKAVNPHSLIPFYESFGMPFYQCFWKDWYPESEMGNVYYSGAMHTISDPVDKSLSVEEMSFPTFVDWLFFYLEAVL